VLISITKNSETTTSWIGYPVQKWRVFSTRKFGSCLPLKSPRKSSALDHIHCLRPRTTNTKKGDKLGCCPSFIAYKRPPSLAADKGSVGSCGHGSGGGSAGGAACASAAQGCRLLGSRLARVRRRPPRPRQVQAAPLALRQLRPCPRRDPAGARPPRPRTPPRTYLAKAATFIQ
jgi:hypothetical protein